MPKPAKCIHPHDMKFELTAPDLRDLSDKWLQTKRARQFRAMPFCCFLFSVFVANEKHGERLKTGKEVA